MKFSEFRKFRPNTSRNVFSFICEDDYLVEESLPLWTKMFPGNWVFERLHSKEFEEIDFGRFMDEALTPSLFSQSRVLVVKNAEKLKKERVEALGTLRDVATSSLKVILVFNSTRDAPMWAKTFSVVQVDAMKGPETGKWLMERFGVGADVARYVVDAAGTDMHTLHNEMEKLKTYVGDKRAVKIEDVDASILRAERFERFALDDAILDRDYRKVVHVVGFMLEEGTEPPLVLWSITRVWRQIFIGKGLAGRQSARDVALAAGVPPFKSTEFAAACRKYGWERLASGFRDLLHADRAFKTSNPRPETYFNILLWKLVGE